MARGLSAMPKLHGEFKPEPGWERAGTTPDGKQLWRERTPRTRPVPDYEVLTCPDCKGKKQLKCEECESKTKTQQKSCEECGGTTKVPCERCEASGEVQGPRKQRLHPVTGEPLLDKNKAEHYIHERLFYVESDGQGNQYKVDWSPATEEEIAAAERAKKIREVIPAVAGALVDSGLSPDEIAARLSGSSEPPRRPAEEDGEEAEL